MLKYGNDVPTFPLYGLQPHSNDWSCSSYIIQHWPPLFSLGSLLGSVPDGPASDRQLISDFTFHRADVDERTTMQLTSSTPRRIVSHV